jgi:hypothetical protein
VVTFPCPNLIQELASQICLCFIHMKYMTNDWKYLEFFGWILATCQEMFRTTTFGSSHCHQALFCIPFISGNFSLLLRKTKQGDFSLFSEDNCWKNGVRPTNVLGSFHFSQYIYSTVAGNYSDFLRIFPTFCPHEHIFAGNACTSLY